MTLELQSTHQPIDIDKNYWLVDELTRNFLRRAPEQGMNIYSFSVPESGHPLSYTFSFKGWSTIESSPTMIGTIEKARTEEWSRMVTSIAEYFHDEGSTLATKDLGEFKKFAEMALLEEEYHFVKPTVKAYVSSNEHLIEPLVETKHRVEMYFGEDVILRLDNMVEPEEEYESLSISVVCHCEPEEAMDLLTAFYREWWLDVDFEIRRHIGFTLKCI